MELDKDSDNQIIAVETFTPDLIGEYAECYNALVKKLTGVLAANRVTVIKKEISDIDYWICGVCGTDVHIYDGDKGGGGSNASNNTWTRVCRSHSGSRQRGDRIPAG